VTGVRFADLLSRYIWSKLGAEHDSYIEVVPQRFIRDILAKADPAKITSDSFLPPDLLLQGTAYCNQFWLPGGDDGALRR
jgi:hypothetical protein